VRRLDVISLRSRRAIILVIIVEKVTKNMRNYRDIKSVLHDERLDKNTEGFTRNR
jgi:hypothetical protein